ncbi:MAG: ribosome-associated translation inhibitor RaiA [Clostridiales bacterium]|nr:ribosome-associated translation inhibitor RaiA [Clostridiales bacterium]
MNITIIGRKCSPRESFKERAEKKLGKIDKFFDAEASAKITVTVEKSFQSVEITVNNGGMIFRAQERAENMNDALDKCVDTLIRKIRKYKTKLEKRIKSGAFDDFAAIEADMSDADDISEENEFEIIRTKSVAVKPQSVEEAILQMNMLGHEFYMFINAATEQICVVYRRKNGGYGLLEPAEE